MIKQPLKSNNSRRWLRYLLHVLLIFSSAAGFVSLELDTDLLSIFPQKNPQVETMSLQKDSFEQGGRLIIQLEAKNAEAAEQLPQKTALLADSLSNHHLCSKVLYRPIWEEDKEQLVDLISYLWINGSPEQTKKLLGSVSKNQLPITVQDAQEELALTMDTEEMAKLARDPLGFLQHSSLEDVGSGNSTANPFVSADGLNQLLIVYPKNRDLSSGTWFKTVQQKVNSHTSAESYADYSIHLTGSPAFAGEIADNVKRDVALTVAISAIFSGIIFWLIVRSNRLIHWQILFIASILTLTLGIGSLILGSLTLMSAGFASILVGLAVDYGMIICTEARRSGHQRTALSAKVNRPIICAALSTSVVFATLSLSQLPGIKELGVFVAVGILISAFLLLSFYVPIAANLAPQKEVHKAHSRPLKKKRKSVITAKIVTGFILTISIWSLSSSGVPRVNFDLEVMTSSKSSADKALKKLTSSFPEQFSGQQMNLIVQAQSDFDMIAKLKKTESLLESLESSTPQNQLKLSQLWPNREHQNSNKAQLKKTLVNSRNETSSSAIINELKAAGYQKEAIQFNQTVLDSLTQYAADDELSLPRNPKLKSLFSTFFQQSPNKLALIPIKVEHSDSHLESIISNIEQSGVSVSSWKSIESSISQVLSKDLGLIVSCVLVGVISMLVLALRKFYDCLVGLICLVTPLLLVAVIVQHSSLSWNFLNIFALPLLLGMGVDYVIHIIFALRRDATDSQNPYAISKGIQKTLIACGLTSVIGFASLTLSSNKAFVSLGIICGLGLLFTMLFCLLILPLLIKSRDAKRR